MAYSSASSASSSAAQLTGGNIEKGTPVWVYVLAAVVLIVWLSRRK